MDEFDGLRRSADGAVTLRRSLDEVAQAAARSDSAMARLGGNGLAVVDRRASGVAQGLGRVASSSRGVENALGRAFSGALRDGAELDRVVKRLAFDLGKLAVTNVLKPSSGGGSGGGSAVTGLLGGLFGQIFGSRAQGGPVAASRPYLVGERGPEVFVPDRAGQVVASGAGAAGAAPVAVNVSISTPDVAGFQASSGQLRGQIADAVRAGMRRR